MRNRVSMVDGRWSTACALLALLLCIFSSPVFAVDPPPGPATVTVADTIYRADGTAASGNVQISWQQFTTADGKAVAAGQNTVAIGAAGAFSAALVPNEGATPAGTFYTVKVFAGAGTPYTEYWIVPASGPVTIAAVRVASVGPVLNVLSVTLGGTGAQGFTPLYCIHANADGSKLVSASGDCGTSSKPRRFYPAESCNGSNVTFTFGATPAAADQFHLYWNGLALDLVDDYTLSGAIVTAVRPCKTGDKLYAIF